MSRLSGTVTLSGNAVSGATVYVVDTSNNTVAATVTTDANGDWEATGLAQSASERYHALVQYDDGSTKYNAESLPYLSTPGIIEPGVSTISVNSPMPSITAPPIPDSAVYYSIFDEGSGSTITDKVTKTEGNINGATWQSGDGTGGYHLTFDDTDDVVDTNVSLMSGSQNRTVAAWVNPNKTGNLDHIFGWGTSNASSRFEMVLSDTNLLRLELGAGGATSSLRVTANEWSFVAVSLDGSTLGDVLFYVDGSTDSVLDSQSISTDSDAAKIGQSDARGLPFGGKIDSPWVADRAYTTSELDDWREETKSYYGL